MGPAFQAAGLATKLLVGEANWDTATCADAAFSDSATLSFIEGASWHAYQGDPYAIQAVAAKSPSKSHHLTERRSLQSDSLDTDQAIMAGDLGTNAVRKGHSSITLWNFALDQSGLPVENSNTGRRGIVSIQNDGSGTITRNPEFYFLAHPGRFVKPGAAIISSTGFATGSSGADLETSAWKNTDGSKVLFIWNGAGSAKTASITDAENTRNEQYRIGGNKGYAAIGERLRDDRTERRARAYD